MDVAYDHVQEESLPDVETDKQSDKPPSNLNTELQEAFKAVSSSQWGTTLGGWFGQVKKQSETLYQDVSKEATPALAQASRGFNSLRDQVVASTKGMTLSSELSTFPEGEHGQDDIPDITTTEYNDTKPTTTETENNTTTPNTHRRSLTRDNFVKEAGSIVATLRSTAAAKLKDLQAAEDAADEALLKFGLNVRNFLREAVTITAPGDDDGSLPRGTDGAGNEVLFETQEPGTGKKVFHGTRLDAQLHAIHTTSGSFTEDPQGEEWEIWKGEFDVGKQTEAIAGDLEKYEELRRAMERLVPEKVDYALFWTRYYFLRKAIEEEERRRKEVLQGAAGGTEEEVGWDDDEDEEENATPNAGNGKFSASTTTLTASAASDFLKPISSSRRSLDENKSVAGSDASYDIVSGATSRAMGSPKEDKHGDDKGESDDDDWE